MSYNISKIKLEKFSLFTICSKKFGYGHFNRAQNLISILKNKNKKFNHFSYGIHYKDEDQFLDKIRQEISLKKKIIIDFTNKFFVKKNTISKLKKIFKNKKNSIFIIDEPSENNLSIALNLNNTYTLIPFDIDEGVKKKFLSIKKIKFGFEYFIYPIKKIKKEKKLFDIMISFGGSDNFKGTLYVLKLLQKLKLKKKILVIKGKHFKKNYRNKLLEICKKNKFKINSFSKNFDNLLNRTRLLITNSGLTKYEGVLHNLPVVVFSDTKKSQKIDKVFIKKTKQFHFSYKKNKLDFVKLNDILDKKLNLKLPENDNTKYKLHKNKLISFFKQ